VLSKPNRVVRAEDFRATMRRGRRLSTEHSVLYFAHRDVGEPARFGFVVAKSVGGAVTRNLMRRRLRAIGHELLGRGYSSTDVVVRALPGSEKLSWASLHEEISTGIERGTKR
jgi:ribonuclease P protein component